VVSSVRFEIIPRSIKPLISATFHQLLNDTLRSKGSQLLGFDELSDEFSSQLTPEIHRVATLVWGVFIILLVPPQAAWGSAQKSLFFGP